MRLEGSARHSTVNAKGLRRPIVLLAVVAAAIATIAVPFAGAQSATPAAGEDLALRVGVVSDLITDNPWAVSAGSDWVVVTLQYDMMLKFA